jgi:hypothetical protein
MAIVNGKDMPVKAFQGEFQIARLFSLATMVIGEGTINIPEGITDYPEATSVSIVATPAPGWEFSHWSGDITGIADLNSNSITINVDREYSIFANFVKLETPTTTPPNTTITTTLPNTTTTPPVTTTTTTTTPLVTTTKTTKTQPTISPATSVNTPTQQTTSTTPTTKETFNWLLVIIPVIGVAMICLLTLFILRSRVKSK